MKGTLEFRSERVFSKALAAAYSLRMRLRELLKEDFPSETGRRLCELFWDVTTQLIAEIHLELQAFRSAPTKPDLSSRKARRLGQACARLCELIRYIEAAQVRRSPTGIVLSLEALAQRLLPRSALLVCPQWEDNYEHVNIMRTLRDFLGPDIETKLEEIQKGLPEQFSILVYPELARLSVLGQPLWGHELGHLMWDAMDPYPAVADQVNSDGKRLSEVTHDRVVAWPEERMQHGVSFAARVDPRLGVVDLLSGLLEKWAEELYCDICCLYLFGPAGFLALADLVVARHPLDYRDFTEYYPPPRLRLKLMIEEFKELGYPDVLAAIPGSSGQKIRDEFQTWESIALGSEEDIGYSEQVRIEDEPVCEEIVRASRDLVHRIVPSLRRLARQHVGDSSFKPKDLSEAAWPLAQVLGAGVPPVERAQQSGQTVVASMPDILNAGWLHAIASGKGGKIPQSVEEVDEHFAEMLEFDGLITRAVELSHIADQFHRRRDELEGPLE